MPEILPIAEDPRPGGITVLPVEDEDEPLAVVSAAPPSTSDFPDVPVGEAMGGPPGGPTMPQVRPVEETRSLHRTAMFGRAAQAFGRGVMEAADLDRPLGIDPEEVERARDYGMFNAPEDRGRIGLFTTPKDLLESAVTTAGVGVDFIFRAVDAPFRGAIESIGSVASDLGASEYGVQRLKDDIEVLLLSGAVALGQAPVHQAPAAAAAGRARTVREVERIVDDALEDAPASVRADARIRVREEIDTAYDDAMRASIDEKIDVPTAVEIAEGSYRAEYGSRVRDTVERFRTEAIDGFDPVRRLEEVARAEDLIPPDLSPYRDLRLLRGLPGQIEAVQRRGTLRWNDAGDIEFSGEGLLPIFENVGDDMAEVMRYFAGRRAQELTERGIETPFSADEIEWMVRRAHNRPEFEDAFQRYQGFTQRNLDFARQSGRISQEQMDRIIELNQSYVPFFRVMDNIEEGSPLTTGNPLQRIEGGERNINDIFANINRNAIMWTRASVENHAKLQVYEMIDRMTDAGMTGIARRINEIPDEVRVADNRVREALEELGVSDDGIVQAFTGNRLEGAHTARGNPIDVVYRDGQRILYEIEDPLLYKAIQHISPQALAPIIRYMAIPAQVRRVSITLHPNFIAPNMSRDTFTAAIQSPNIFIPFIDTARGLFTRTMKDKDYWDAMANGAGFGSFMQNEFHLADGAADYYRRFGVKYERQVLDSPAKIGDFLSDAVRSLGRGIEELSSITEQGTRARQFQISRGQGASDRQSAFDARDISTDFSVRGASSWMRAITAMSAFTNARIQSFDRMARLGGSPETAVRTWTRSFLLQTVPAMALYDLNHENPDYWALPDWVRDQHFVIPNYNDDGEWEPYLIPKAFEYGALFSSGAERMAQLVERQHGPTFAKFWVRTIGDTFGMNPVPDAFEPLMELGMNRGFTGRPIIPADLEGIRGSDQYREWTSDTLVELAHWMREEVGVEMSPMQVEHLLRGYTATLGMDGLAMSDWLVRNFDEDSGEDPTPRLDEMPLLRRFIRESPLRGTQFETDFYDLLNASREQVIAHRLYQRGLRPEATFNEREQWLIDVNDRLEAMSRRTGVYRTAMRQVMADPDMSAEEKRRELDELQAAINEVMIETMRDLPEDELRQQGILPPPGGSN